jgi:hypothetical protein
MSVTNEYELTFESAADDAANMTDTEDEIDVNDPRLTTELIQINPEGDAYARRPVLKPLD